ncbi:Protein of unknown function [Clostridium acidisoli DSM 12555]|uniref:DUF3606 domain-containing protein n=1 Tax=Clostridium acidisoli DSM 12555 TaxID=1121291 RepID=A0A1W1X0E0_9CLOT|nr:DUF3606 domain-containing protein [Clostridium acidisoli]SMC17432.1 Protein of unknown function [Clostridium acidisoli DSM 12555]
MLLFGNRTKTKTYSKTQSDYLKIDIFDEEDLKFWCKRFNCTEDALMAAVNIVGVSANKVENYFNEN